VDTDTMTRTRSGSWLSRLLHRLDEWTLYAFNPSFPTHPHCKGR
jgi:hypothetical protein